MIIGYAKEFDFDSLAPVQAEDFQSNAILLEIQAYLIDKLKVVNVLLAGAYAIKWWYYGGYWHMYYFIQKQLPWLIRMMEHGQI